MTTTYFVSGFMRSGTSMMMRCLHMGGLDPAFNPTRDKMNDQWGDEFYKPNGNGFYELSREQYQAFDFPRAYEGKLVKCLWGGITKIIPGDYKIVFMRRDPEEIVQSHDAFFGNKPRFSKTEIEERLNIAVGILRERRDCHVEEIWYRDVVQRPLETFEYLKDQGWNIDPHAAADVVNSDLCRFRRENLEDGI